MRSGIEKLIVETLIKNVSDELFEKLQKNIDETKAVLLAHDNETPIAVHEAALFHIELARGTNNPLFEILEESLLKVMRAFKNDRCHDYEFNEYHLSIHTSLYKALRDKNLSQSLRCLDEHTADLLNCLQNSNLE